MAILNRQIIGVIGGGNLGKPIIRRLTQSGYNVLVSARTLETCHQLQEQFDVRTTLDNQQIFDEAATVLLAVKPNQCNTLLRQFRIRARSENPLNIISLLAGKSCSSLEIELQKRCTHPEIKINVVRCMANIAAVLGESSSLLFSSKTLAPSEKENIEEIIRSFGSANWLASEEAFNCATTVAGCGPAYLFLLMQTQIEALHKMGVPIEIATKITVQATYGSAKLVTTTERSLPDLITQVATPNGVTAAALQVFRQHNINDIVSRALDAAKKRSDELEKTTSIHQFFHNRCNSLRNPFDRTDSLTPTRF